MFGFKRVGYLVDEQDNLLGFRILSNVDNKIYDIGVDEFKDLGINTDYKGNKIVLKDMGTEYSDGTNTPFLEETLGYIYVCTLFRDLDNLQRFYPDIKPEYFSDIKKYVEEVDNTINLRIREELKPLKENAELALEFYKSNKYDITYEDTQVLKQAGVDLFNELADITEMINHIKDLLNRC